MLLCPDVSDSTHRTQMCMLNSCKEGFQFCLAPITPSEESLSIKRAKKRRTRTHRRHGDQGVQFETLHLKPGALSRYYLTAEYRTVYVKTLSGMIGQGSSKLPHPDMYGPRIRKDEAHVKSLINLMENNWLNPLPPDESDLVSLSTCTVAPPAVVQDLLRALGVGEEAYQTFTWTRLNDDPPSVKSHKTTKQTLKTFSTISTKTSRMKGQNVVLKAERKPL